MNSLRPYQNLRVMLLLAAILLAAQSLLLWHTHDGKITPDDTCQLCLHAQHHSSAPTTVHAPTLTLFTQIAIVDPVNTDTIHAVYHFYTPSRAPPTLFLS